MTRETSCNHHNRGIATSTVDLDLFVSFYSFVINLFNLLFVARKRLLEAISFKKNLYKIETIFVFLILLNFVLNKESIKTQNCFYFKVDIVKVSPFYTTNDLKFYILKSILLIYKFSIVTLNVKQPV